ncbi:branched-chain amino acid transport system permease protein [Nonomuraea solani]|uniref:Branched-chain amino acid transport system permease protein n=1 Tax=Nonomuraea solani TaxID=1144553 RepID=A0A1H6ESZ2_9ACTN|nr:branched-chain amino acid ABC transporter permease [Nonomuraea solani]SEH00978.1 branched-chain amino acid transport system permease protein [Nonomuraea solani]
MSDDTLAPARPAPAEARARTLPSHLPVAAAVAAAIVVALVLPLYVDAFWLRIGLFAMASAVGALGLTILFGAAGQLSLGHAFFVAVGTYGYAFLAGDGGGQLGGLGLPPLVAAVLATLLAGLCGLLFSPIAGRLRGIYLGIASLGLVFLGHHLLLNLRPVTGGYDGRSVTPFALGGFVFSDAGGLVVLGVPFGAVENLWYLFLAVTVVAVLVARNVLRGRPGRAFRLIRDSEVGAAAMGVRVQRTKSAAFVLSSMYAGTAGVLTALAFQRAVPDYFDLHLSIDFLAMIVLGGLGSTSGAIIGATFVVALPIVLARYADVLPLVAGPGQEGLEASIAAQFVYGALVVVVMLTQPGGLRAMLHALRDRRGPAAP